MRTVWRREHFFLSSAGRVMEKGQKAKQKMSRKVENGGGKSPPSSVFAIQRGLSRLIFVAICNGQLKGDRENDQQMVRSPEQDLKNRTWSSG